VASELKYPYWRQILAAGCAKVGPTRYYATAVAVVALGTFGAWLLLGGVLLAILLLRRQVSAVDAAPWVAVAIFLTLFTTLNDFALTGHHFELIHRPLVWVYFLLCTWTAARGCQLLAATTWGRRLLAPGVVAAMGVPLLLLPLELGRRVQEGKSDCRFCCVHLHEARGLIDAAGFVARTAAPLDVVQDSRCDPFVIVGGFAERRSYVARPQDWAGNKSQEIREEAQRRAAFVERLKRLTDGAALRRAADESGIRWFILHPEDAVAWPESVSRAPAFVSHGYRVYDLRITGRDFLSESDRGTGGPGNG
ncbi:MAG TPA: hypothetical protein VEL76_14060, partial [Gemmataceae bacterium]|nr:hypothetical protein [Gemmataceae bacterium]